MAIYPVMAFVGLLAQPMALAVSSATVSWNKNPESDVVGYKLAYGTAVGNYNNLVNAGTTPTAVVQGLTEGVTYYFVVSAVNQAQQESPPSSVVSYFVPPVTPANRAPVALANSLTVSEDGFSNLVLTGTDADNDSLSFTVVRAPANGNLSGTPPNLIYTPNANYYGSDNFTFRANDGQVNSATATISITVSSVNDAPTTNSFSVSTSGNTPLPILLNGSDIDSFTLSYSVINGPANGSLSGTAPNLTYTPTSNFVGSDQFTYRVNDGSLNSATATVSISITPIIIPPTAPIAQSSSISTPEDTPVNLVLTATDANNDSLTYSIVRSPSNGILSGNPPNLRYTPAANYNGSDNFTFRANDGSSNSAVATISITIQPVNDAPVAAAQTVSTVKNTQLPILLSGSDPDANTLSYSVVNGPTNGTLSGTAPNLTYEPTTNFVGSDQVTFRVNDGSLDSATATITITITQIVVTPAAPVALASSISTLEDTPVNLVLTATDANNDPLTYSISRSPSNGTLSGTPPNLKYTPNANYNGSDSFTFRANDGNSNSARATISITILPVNDAPVAAAQTLSTNKNTQLLIVLSGSDPDSTALSFSVINGPANGTLSGTSPNLTYQPSTNFVGSDQFTFRVNDGSLNSATATVSISVAQEVVAPTAPVALASSLSTLEDTPANLVLTATDANNDPLTYSISRSPSKGTLSGTPPNLKYTPNADANGSDSFTFRANDGTSNSALATISITILPVNDAPVAAAQTVSTNKNTQLSVVLSGSDKDSNTLSYSVVTGPTNGTLSGTAPNLTYRPSTNFVGADEFTFLVNDGLLNSAVAKISINVAQVSPVTPPTAPPPTTGTPTPVPPMDIAPVFTSNPIYASDAYMDQPYEGSTLSGMAVDTGAVTYSKVSGPEWLNVDASGDLSGTPPADNAGLNTFVVRATGSTFSSADAELQITVTGMPLPWKNRNLGAKQDLGSTTYDVAGFTLNARNGWIEGTKDTFRFTYQMLSKNGTISAKINSLPKTDTTGLYGVMIRSSLAQNARQVFMGLANEKSFRWVTRANEGRISTTKSSTTSKKSDTWVRLVSKNGRITAYKSSNGKNWTFVGSTKFDMPSECYVGLAVAGSKDSKDSNVQFSNVIVNP